MSEYHLFPYNRKFRWNYLLYENNAPWESCAKPHGRST